MTEVAEEINLPDDCNELIKEVLIEKGFPSDIKYKVTAGSEKGDNYVGEIYRIVADEKEKKCALILKIAPLDKIKREKMQSVKIFAREIIFYEEIFPRFDKFQKERKKTNHFTSVARCFRTREDLLILEDLKVDGYRMENRLLGLKLPQVTLLLQQLAKFHAFSYAFKDQQPEEFKKFEEKIPEILFGGLMPKEIFRTFADHAVKIGESVITENKYMDKLKIFTTDYFDNMYRLTHSEDSYSCINHGDCWVNNILFKYSEENLNEPQDLKMLDFQVIRVGPPILDISYLIYCSTRKCLRDEHLENLLNIYFSELHKNITELGSDPEKLYPREIFDKHVKEYMSFGLGMALMVLPIMTATKEEVPDFEFEDPSEMDEQIFEKQGQQMQKLTESEICKERLGNVITEMIDRGFI